MPRLFPDYVDCWEKVQLEKKNRLPASGSPFCKYFPKTMCRGISFCRMDFNRCALLRGVFGASKNVSMKVFQFLEKILWTSEVGQLHHFGQKFEKKCAKIFEKKSKNFFFQNLSLKDNQT